MAFPEKLAEQKLQIRLSALAQEVIADDMFTFQETREGSFLNKVFIAYHTDAAASISIQIQKLRKHYKDMGIPDNIIDILCKDMSNETLSAVNEYPSKFSKRFYLQNDVMEHLTNEDAPLDGYPCRENEFKEFYHGRISEYFKAVIEEYARKAYFEREKIYKKEILKEINEAAERKHDRYAVQISMRNGKHHLVIPYKTETDPQCIYNYLVALPCSSLSKWTSYRVSNIVSVDKRKSESGFLSPAQKAEADEAIRKYGVQFLSNDLAKIRVRLTKSGVKKYQTQLHLRPKVDRIENGSEYVFYCTEAQAEFYFFKFGADAEILEPAGLANKFLKMYQNAYKIYADRAT